MIQNEFTIQIPEYQIIEEQEEDQVTLTNQLQIPYFISGCKQECAKQISVDALQDTVASCGKIMVVNFPGSGLTLDKGIGKAVDSNIQTKALFHSANDPMNDCLF